LQLCKNRFYVTFSTLIYAVAGLCNDDFSATNIHRKSFGTFGIYTSHYVMTLGYNNFILNNYLAKHALLFLRIFSFWQDYELRSLIIFCAVASIWYKQCLYRCNDLRIHPIDVADDDSMATWLLHHKLFFSNRQFGIYMSYHETTLDIGW